MIKWRDMRLHHKVRHEVDIVTLDELKKEYLLSLTTPKSKHPIMDENFTYAASMHIGHFLYWLQIHKGWE